MKETVARREHVFRENDVLYKPPEDVGPKLTFSTATGEARL
jgi:hypothetical protein